MLPLIIGLVISLITSNVLLTAYALITLWYIYITLWKKGQPPILFAAFAMQWLQVSIKILQADLTSQAIEDVVIYPEDIQYAILLSLTSLIIIVTGLNTIIHKLKTNPPVYQTLIQYDIKKVVVVYIVAVILTYFLTKYSFVIGGLQQFIVKLVDFKWAIFFVFFLISDTKNRYNAFIIILIVEIALGLTGYFSNFKSFIFLTAITFIFSKQKLSLKEWGVATFLGFIVLNFMIVWQSVKGDYRNFLSGGERQQTVTVSSTEALDELGNLTSNIDYDSYNIGTESLIDRIAYVDFFSVTISNTNKNNLFEGGKLWYSAISNVLMPRFLFPDKAEIDDSEKTRKYAGVEVVGADQGTSISLGYVAETYVDFGPILMFLPLFGFGLLIGWIYKFIVTKSVNILWGFAFSTPLFFQLSAFEMALDKIVASIIAYFLVYLLLRKIFIRKLQAFITKN
ncbi:hypothetical protein [Pedobacter xixiisoli]|nr:hypothetical protein [Pedobacter xixiisoli]